MKETPIADAAPREPTPDDADSADPARRATNRRPRFPFTPPVAALRTKNPDPAQAPRAAPAPATPENPKPSRHTGTGASWVWVYDTLCSAIRVRHYSPKTLEVYKFWTQRLQTYTRSKDCRFGLDGRREGVPQFPGGGEAGVGVSQNQAFNALLFLFRHVLEKDFGRVEGVVRAERRPYIPVVLSREEVYRVVQHLDDPYGLVVRLLYGCGLRLFECLKLRVRT